jgi:hypothetical protein
VPHPLTRTGQHDPGGTQKGIPPVRGYLAGAFYCECEGRGRPVGFAAKPGEPASPQEGTTEQHHNRQQ